MTYSRQFRKQDIFYENQSLLKAFQTYFGGDPIFDLVNFEPGIIVIHKLRKFVILRELTGDQLCSCHSIHFNISPPSQSSKWST